MTVTERIRAEREAQGLDPVVSDPSALARIAILISKGGDDASQ